MTITPTTRDRRSFSARFATITTVSLGLLAGPVAFAGPASAGGGGGGGDHPRHDNCSVTAYEPKAVGHHGKNAVTDDRGKKDRKSVDVKFAFKIHCDKRTKVYFNQKMFQEHGRWDKLLGSDHGWVWVHGDKRIANEETATADRGDKFVKVFHVVKITFKDDDNSRHSSWKSDRDESAHVKIWVQGGHH